MKKNLLILLIAAILMVVSTIIIPIVHAAVTIKAILPSTAEVEITVLSDTDILALKYFEADNDEIIAEIEKRIREYVDRQKHRLVKEWIERLREDPAVNNIPIDIDDFIEYIATRPDYKDKATRDAEAGE